MTKAKMKPIKLTLTPQMFNEIEDWEYLLGELDIELNSDIEETSGIEEVTLHVLAVFYEETELEEKRHPSLSVEERNPNLMK
jgi:hypothetical protein